ncbi:glycosyltransferase family 2 protein [uncultured Olleya sp.]|uniref:glycosyltransferase family 2 protein n=1 Tax=uncultured Olleya sp. TaxID=757243 RepID=UPI0025974DFB|nr:glycosyltransferase family 2 protein [uncultured Olleya sp.]
MQPAITIIIATYNRAHFIVEMLNAISKQTFKSWECIIIDDGGTDNTETVISSLLKDDSRFKYFKRTNKYKKGLCGSRNYGLDIARGDYIIFFDDDDLVHPKNLEIAHQVIIDNDTDFCHYQKQSFVSEKPKAIDLEVEVKGNISVTNIEVVVTGEIGLASCTVLWKKECFKTIRFNEDLQYAEEWECYLNIISNGFKGVIIGNILYYNRKHKNSNTGEFWNDNPRRIESYVKSRKLVCENLIALNLMNRELKKYFIHNAYTLKAKTIVSKLLEQSFLNKVYFWMFPLKFKLFKMLKQF